VSNARMGRARSTTDISTDWHSSGSASAPSPATKIAYGRWSPTISRDEPGQQHRSTAALALIYLGPDHRLVAELRDAEVDPMVFVRAQSLIEALPALTRCRILGMFSRVTCPPRRATR
jgi:hypothetical protein